MISVRSQMFTTIINPRKCGRPTSVILPNKRGTSLDHHLHLKVVVFFFIYVYLLKEPLSGTFGKSGDLVSVAISLFCHVSIHIRAGLGNCHTCPPWPVPPHPLTPTSNLIDTKCGHG